MRGSTVILGCVISTQCSFALRYQSNQHSGWLSLTPNRKIVQLFSFKFHFLLFQHFDVIGSHRSFSCDNSTTSYKTTSSLSHLFPHFLFHRFFLLFVKLFSCSWSHAPRLFLNYFKEMWVGGDRRECSSRGEEGAASKKKTCPQLTWTSICCSRTRGFTLLGPSHKICSHVGPIIKSTLKHGRACHPVPSLPDTFLITIIWTSLLSLPPFKLLPSTLSHRACQPSSS